MNSSHQIKIDNLKKEWTFDTFLNIQKRRESILYRSNSNPRNVNLAYVQGGEVNSLENLSIRDRSTVLAENRTTSLQVDQRISNTSGFNIETEQFLVTDIFTETAGNQPQLPLFYQHVLDINLSSLESVVEIQVLDEDFQPVNLADIRIDLENKTVYNNLINSFDPISGLFELYYVTFLVRNTLSGAHKRFTQLINNQPIFREADFNDLDELGNIIPGRKVYILQEDIGATFSVVLPVSSTYGIRRLVEQRLRVLPPPASTVNDPWFVSVQNSKFISAVETTPGATSIFKYRIAEFTAQNFFPFFPYKLANETSQRVSKRIIKTIRNKIVQNPEEGIFVDVIVYDENENAKFALTSDPNKLSGPTLDPNVFYANVLLGDPTTAGVQLNDKDNPVAGSSLDSLNGFIVLPAGFEIEENDIIRTAYFYEEERYEISFFNLNPLNRVDLIKQRLVVFVRPEPLGGTLTQTLFYLLVNEDGKVIDSNYNIDGVEGTLTDGSEVQQLISEEKLWYDRQLNSNGDPIFPPFASTGSIDFVNAYTVQGRPNTQSFLVLGEVFVRESSAPSSLVLNDIRIRGGGIDEYQFDEAFEIQPEINWNWDIGMWDGYPYPGAASYFVDIPVYVLEDCGGHFASSTVRGIINRHTGIGIYPVIHKYNDHEPTVTEVNVTTSGIKLEWTEHFENTIFDIYQSRFETGPWELVASGLVNNSTGNEYLLEIPEGATRFIVISGREKDGPICFSGPIDTLDPGFVQ